MILYCCRLGSLSAAHAAALAFHIDYVIDRFNNSSGRGGAEASRQKNATSLRTQLLDVVRKLEQLKQGRKGTASVAATDTCFAVSLSVHLLRARFWVLECMCES
jgi:hypothetical protein